MANVDKPQLSASVRDIFHVFFYPQHEQSYHIVNKGNFHLSRNRRKLHAVSKRIQNYEFFLPQQHKSHINGKVNRIIKKKVAPHTWCIFTNITSGNFTGICKTNPYMSASKFVAHMDLSLRSKVSIAIKMRTRQCNNKK